MEDVQEAPEHTETLESSPHLESSPESTAPETSSNHDQEEKAPMELAAQTEAVLEQEGEQKEKEEEQPSGMRAAFYNRYGSAAELNFTTQHPKPHITKKNDVLIRVHATSINPVDWKLMAGNLKIVQFGKIFPFTPCFDVSGVVADVGTNPSALSSLRIRLFIEAELTLFACTRHQLQTHQEGRRGVGHELPFLRRGR
jgi:hypothetical protein